MTDYARMYHLLFHAITGAIDRLERLAARQGDPGGELAGTVARLMRAQQAAEADYLDTAGEAEE